MAAAVIRPPGLGWFDEGAHENEERLAEPVAHTLGHGGAQNGADAMAASSAMAAVLWHACAWRKSASEGQSE